MLNDANHYAMLPANAAANVFVLLSWLGVD